MRAEKLSPAKRREIAKAAANGRWHSSMPKATHSGELVVGDITIPCFVLDDGTRVISQRSLQTGVGMNVSGGAQRLVKILGTFSDNSIDTKDLTLRIENPVVFRAPGIGPNVHGYEATVLVDLCKAIISARNSGVLRGQQQHIAERCEILLMGFATVGIVALVDEATGYQYERAREALATILETFIQDELGKWAKRFPDEYYEQLFRLKGLDWPSEKNPPQWVGHLTNNIVYKRLAPGVLGELKTKNPKDNSGRRKNRHHQWLTEDVGHPKLQEHIAAAIVLMRVCDNWESFESMLNRALPRQPQNVTEQAQKKLPYKTK